MQNLTVTAVTVRAVDYRENDKIITLFVPETGLITARLKGVKKARSRLKFAAEPFCYGEFELVSSRPDNYIVTGCRPKNYFNRLRESVQALYAGSVMLRFCTLFAVSGPADFTPLFRLLVLCLTLLEFGTDSEAEICAYFLLSALSISGYNLKRRLTAAYISDGAPQWSDSNEHIKRQIMYSITDKDTKTPQENLPSENTDNGKRADKIERHTAEAFSEDDIFAEDDTKGFERKYSKKEQEYQGHYSGAKDRLSAKQGAVRCLYVLLWMQPDDVAVSRFNRIYIKRALDMLAVVVEKITEQRFFALRELINMVK